jgi:hypothetical protein
MILYKKGGNLAKIECHNPKCDWSWNVKDAGKDKYVCHKCGTDNTKFYGSGGTIHIDKNKRGTFTAAATKHGMGVQEFATKVLADKSGKYTSLMHRKANFARNSTKFKH